MDIWIGTTASIHAHMHAHARTHPPAPPHPPTTCLTTSDSDCSTPAVKAGTPLHGTPQGRHATNSSNPKRQLYGQRTRHLSHEPMHIWIATRTSTHAHMHAKRTPHNPHTHPPHALQPLIVTPTHLLARQALSCMAQLRAGMPRKAQPPRCITLVSVQATFVKSPGTYGLARQHARTHTRSLTTSHATLI
jgi:hypothetical protein